MGISGIIGHDFGRRLKETKSLSYSIDCMVQSSNLLFHAFLYLAVALPDLEINVAVFHSLLSFSLK